MSLSDKWFIRKESKSSAEILVKTGWQCFRLSTKYWSPPTKFPNFAFTSVFNYLNANRYWFWIREDHTGKQRAYKKYNTGWHCFLMMTWFKWSGWLGTHWSVSVILTLKNTIFSCLKGCVRTVFLIYVIKRFASSIGWISLCFISGVLTQNLNNLSGDGKQRHLVYMKKASLSHSTAAWPDPWLQSLRHIFLPTRDCPTRDCMAWG